MGMVFDIQKFSVHDGPGIRTTVFLKGCNLRCIWCHNPESFVIKPQLAFQSENCIGCRKCEEVCIQNAHQFIDYQHRVYFDVCTACGKCMQECMTKALKIFGKEMSVEEVIEEILSDKIYYESSGGGVTFSGGEPTLQFDFLIALIDKCKENHIHICVETNGVMTQTKREKLGEVCDLFLIDYKATPKELHKKVIGDGNTEVLKTLEYLNSINKSVVLRCPIVPGINDTKEHFEQIKMIRNKYNNIQDIEIMPYHSIGRKKWEAIGLEYTLNNLETVTIELKKEWERKV